MRKTLVMILLSVFVLVSCAPATKIVPTKTMVPVSTSTSAPAPATPESLQPAATPTAIQLPFNDKNFESEYCQYQSVKLPISDTQGLSDDEIARKLMDLHLAYFNTPQAPDWCRIDGYKIEEVYYNESTRYRGLEPGSNLMRTVRYSIKLIQIPNMWMSLPGEIDQQNWLHTVADLAIFRLEDGYTMKFAHP
ncbi:MAG: hypothetical protein WHX52_20015 [Anaerolineae bacterium]